MNSFNQFLRDARMLKSRAAQDSCKEIPFLMQTPLLMQKKIHAVAMVLVLVMAMVFVLVMAARW